MSAGLSGRKRNTGSPVSLRPGGGSSGAVRSGSSGRTRTTRRADSIGKYTRTSQPGICSSDWTMGRRNTPSSFAGRKPGRRQTGPPGRRPGILEDYLRKEANRELDNFIRRVKRRLPPGAELKYIAVTSDMDGETGEAVRIHHHIIANRAAWQACVEAWPHGGAYAKSAQRAKGLHAAGGVSAEPGSPPARREEVQALPQPCEASAEVPRRMERGELRVPKGCELLYRTAYSGKRAGQYIRYALPFAPMRS